MALPTPPSALTQITAANLSLILYSTSSPSSDVTTILNMRLADAVQSIKTFLGFDFTPAEATEYYDTSGTEELILARRYVTAVSAVYEDRMGYYGQPTDSFSSDSLLTAGEDYAWKNVGGTYQAVLYRINSSWPESWRRENTRLASSLNPNRGCVKVTYTAGLGTSAASLYADVVGAIYAEAAALALMPTGFGMQTSESIDGRSVAISPLQDNRESSGLVSKQAASKLQRYRIYGLGVG